MSRPAGFRATVAWLAAGQILSWAALYYGFSSFVLPMQRELGWSKPTLMGAFTLGLAVWGAASYASGAAIDRGHGRAVMSWGAVLAGLALLAWSRVQTPWALYAVLAAVGMAMAMTLYEPAFNVLTKRYPQHYRDGITVLTLVAGFASTLSFPAAAGLIALLGWRDALAAIGLVLLLFVAPLHAWVLRGPAIAWLPPGHDEQDDATLHEALRRRSFWLLTLTFMLYNLGAGAVWAHAMPAFAAKGMDERAALAVIVWIGPAQVAGRFVYASFGRGLPLRRIGFGVLACMPVALLLFALSDRGWALALFALLFGIANGMVTILRGGLVPEYFGRSHIGRIGGLMSAVGVMSLALAPLATAWLLLWLPGYREALLLLAGLGFAALAAFALAGSPSAADPVASRRSRAASGSA